MNFLCSKRHHLLTTRVLFQDSPWRLCLLMSCSSKSSLDSMNNPYLGNRNIDCVIRWLKDAVYPGLFYKHLHNWITDRVISCESIFITTSLPNLRSWRAEILRECLPPPTRHLSCGTCHVSCTICHVSLFSSFSFFFLPPFFWTEVWSYSVEGLLSTEFYPV